MSRSARYLIAQHVEDLFRNEPRNVGVFVGIEGERTARFVGDSGNGKIDGRRIVHLPYPDVYKQWVEYWWTTLRDDPQAMQSLLKTSGQHYRVVEGGEVADIGNDSVHDVAGFLYTSLVSEDGMALALGGEEAEIITVPLQEDVGTAFDQLNVLADDSSPLTNVRHPIHRNASVAGKTTTHKPAFYQHNGHPVVMETIDLTLVNKRVALRDHAGWAAFIFGDIKAQNPSAEPISIARITSASENDKNVKYAIELLQSQSRLINWLSDDDRTAFIEERVAVANG
jgi:hypothetical protein